MKNLLLLLLFALTQKPTFEDFDKFKYAYVLKNYESDSLKIKQLILFKKLVTTEIFSQSTTFKTLSTYDSVIHIENPPFYYRRESFMKGNADCICQKNGTDFIRNQLTNYEPQKLNKFRFNSHKPQLDILFFDPIIGWQGISEQKPAIKDTIIDNNLFIKLELNSRNSRRYVHLVEKSSFHLLKTLVIDPDGQLNQEISRKNFKKTENITYPSEMIIDIYVSHQTIRIHEKIESISFKKIIDTTGIFNCQLPYQQIRFYD